METTQPQGARLWLFRLAAMTLIPAAFFLALELILRLLGFGYGTEFFVDAPRSGAVMTNQEFGWRFFPRKLARAPVAAVVEVPKEEDIYRIVVLGGSAARGTPEPAFGFGRMLEVLLESAYPQGKFEVINGAMTAINSHVVLPIARDALTLEPDLFVVYLGNNEVVGPFGAATVFSPYSPRLGMIRARLAAKSWRLGQWVDSVVATPAGGQSEWRGMEMFLEQRIRASDPGLLGVYRHFRTNLRDLVETARGGGAEILLSTVAVNLRDQPPFASLHLPSLGREDRTRFEDLLGLAVDSLEKGDAATALSHLTTAEELDGEYAELHFHRGRALLALGRLEEADRSLQRARDLDALRFRADSQINAVITEVAAEWGVPLVDAESFLRSGGGLTPPLPGRKLFYEHVHLNPAGGYALARSVFEEVEKLLPAEISSNRSASEPADFASVAEKLAFSLYDAEGMEREILAIVSRPPFTGQWGHRQDLIARRALLQRMRQGLSSEAWQHTKDLYEVRLGKRKEDLQTRRRYAELLAGQGEFEQALPHWRNLLHAVPDILSWYDAYSLALAHAGRGSEAVDVLKEAEDRFPQELASILVNLGAVYEQTGEGQKAAEAYRRSWEIDPSVAVGLYNLATMKAREGNLEDAIQFYRELLERHPHFTRGHHNLGVALERRGDLQGAERSYRREIESNPTAPAGYNSLGVVFAEQGKMEEAVAEYAQALARDPGYSPALFNLADHLLSHGHAGEAIAYYEEGLTIDPGNRQARANLNKAREVVRRGMSTS